MSVVYIYDGTLEGLFTVIAKSIKSGLDPEAIVSKGNYQGMLLAEEEYLATDSRQVERLWNYLSTELRSSSVRKIFQAFLSEVPGVEMRIREYIKLSLKHRKRLDLFHTEPTVKYIQDIAAKVSKESYRFKGLIRFRQLKDKALYAPFAPEYRIIHSLADHFIKRLRGEKWVLHDLRRNIALLWDGCELRECIPESSLTDNFRKMAGGRLEYFDPSETDYQALWQCFFDNVAIENRANPRLQRQFLPLKYRKYLIEK